jgi:hypothetical protein
MMSHWERKSQKCCLSATFEDLTLGKNLWMRSASRGFLNDQPPLATIPAANFWVWHFSDFAINVGDVRSSGDSVAKVVLLKMSKVLRAAGAVFV